MLPYMLKDPYYDRVYRQHLQNPSQHVILDNGAAEGQQPSDGELLSLIWHYHPTEYALPDVLGDTWETVERSLKFADEVKQNGHFPSLAGYVAQGQSVNEALRGIEKFLNWTSIPITTIFIPRVLIKFSGDTMARAKVAFNVRNRWPSLDIHLFGAAPEVPHEMHLLQSAHWIRSIDTSMPYCYSAFQQELELKTPQKRNRPTRPNNYFNQPKQVFRMRQPIEQCLRWANGE
jgi:hypothetical protein